MKVLLVTGRLTAGRVKNIAAKHGYGVYVAPVEVASLVTSRQIFQGLTDNKGTELILVPGLMKGDLNELESDFHVPIFRGPKDVADLDFVLENLGKFKLSKTVPACEILEAQLKERALKELKKVDAKKYTESLLRRKGNILIGNLGAGLDFPQRVVAEIAGVEELSNEEIIRKGKYLLNSGADILDLGFGDADPGRAEEAIKALKPLRVPISIDSMEVENIEAALECGVDMVMSFDGELIKRFKNVGVPSVIIPKRGTLPPSPSERVALLERNIKLAKNRGFKKIIADPILMPPPRLLDSLASYRGFSLRHPLDYLILMGAGNVTESFDADSVGLNALLCSLASECNASLLFTVEASDKTSGSVGELRIASKMMYLAKIRDSPPKDLGLDLLILKEKRLKRESADGSVYASEITAQGVRRYERDLMGYIKVFVERDKIRCVHYHKGGAGVSIVGTKAKEIGDTLISMGVVSSLEHALYVGRELQKAEFALEYGKSYTQD